MITLCIDPGLRNLSLCIMNSDYQILLWDTIDVLDSDDYHCVSLFKNGKICNRKCSMKYIGNGENIYTCKTHFPKEIKKKRTNIFKKKSIDKYLLQDIANTFIKKIQDLYLSNDVFKDITNILIELQPQCNRKMLFVSHILYGKLVELYKDTNVPIRFVSATKKLRAYTGPKIECKLKGAYAQRKWLSVKYGEWILENKFSQEQRDKWLPIFLSKTVKPDMSDTLLMAINAISGIPKKPRYLDVQGENGFNYF